MVTISTFLARYWVGGGAKPRRRMPKVSLMSGFEKPPRCRTTGKKGAKRRFDAPSVRKSEISWTVSHRVSYCGGLE